MLLLGVVLAAPPRECGSPADGLPAALQDVAGTTLALRLDLYRSGLASGKLSAASGLEALERSMGSLLDARDARAETLGDRPAERAYPEDRWFGASALDVKEDQVVGDTSIVVPLRADGSTGISWCAHMPVVHAFITAPRARGCSLLIVGLHHLRTGTMRMHVSGRQRTQAASPSISTATRTWSRSR